MYISCLLIDVGENPDRPRPGRLWLRNLYHVHQRLCMAFPSTARKQGDPDFLRPFDPADFAMDFAAEEKKHVHAERDDGAGFLYRIDAQPGGGVVILVQSATQPDWDYAFQNVSFLAAREVKPFDPIFAAGEHFRFRLLANPTRKIDTKSGPDGRRNNGKRVPVPGDKLLDWLAGRAPALGVSINEKPETIVQPGYVYFGKRRDAAGQRLRSARYDGLLTVTDSALLRRKLAQGVGPGKAFGFGLLSLARVPQ